MTTSSCWVRGYNSTPSPTVQSTPVNRTVETALFLAISLHQPPSGKKHSSSRTNILPGSLIPSDKYFLKNLTFVVVSTRVATSPFQSNSLRGQGEEQTSKKQRPSWPTGLIARNSAVSLYGTIYWSALHCW